MYARSYFAFVVQIDGQGFLLVNRDIVTEDVHNFDYTPKAEYEGPFQVHNLADERATLQFFVDHIKQIKPHIIVTYNGDSFDWPFVDERCKQHGISLLKACLVDLCMIV